MIWQNKNTSALVSFGMVFSFGLSLCRLKLYSQHMLVKWLVLCWI